jgi:hypothetical protein
MKATHALVGSALVMLLSLGARAQVVAGREGAVATISQKVAGLTAVDVKDTARFLNDLKLSPYWKVEKNRAGDFEAHLRAIVSSDPFSKRNGKFLSEQSWEENLPADWRIENHAMRADDQATLSVTIVFKKPDERRAGLVAEDGNVSLKVFNEGGPPGAPQKLDANSISELEVKISKGNSVYLLIQEQGESATRAATFAAARTASREAGAVSALPASYRVAEKYAPFFKKLFPETENDVVLKRLPGIQDRDMFYGYLRTKEGTSYEGLNLRVSHPVVSNGEATRESERLRKAEYLGKPYATDDRLFFAIEDNAVYVLPQYSQEYGTFSGNKTFQGKVELLNAEKKTLYQGEEPFKGWER